MSFSKQKCHEIYNNLKYRSTSSSKDFAILRIAVLDPNMKPFYQEKIDKHNKNFETHEFADSGFDLMLSKKEEFDKLFVHKFIDMQVKAEMVYCKIKNNEISYSPFQLFPRSSISKTPLMLANHTGIIDSGYRGNLIGAFRALYFHKNDNDSYIVEKHTRLLQICHPTLCPIYVVMVNEDELTNTERGEGGFGSTGV